VNRVEISDDGGKTWADAAVGEDHGAYSFRTWEAPWKAKSPGRYSVSVRATDEKGNTQLDEPVWNPGGYLWNRIERQRHCGATPSTIKMRLFAELWRMGLIAS